MSKIELDKKSIEALLPHREPMLLIDKLTNIVHLKSATAIMYVKKNGFYVQGHFPGQPGITAGPDRCGDARYFLTAPFGTGKYCLRAAGRQ